MKTIVEGPVRKNPYKKAQDIILLTVIGLGLTLEGLFIWLTVAVSTGFIPLAIIGGVIVIFFTAVVVFEAWDQLEKRAAEWDAEGLSD